MAYDKGMKDPGREILDPISRHKDLTSHGGLK